MAKHTDLCSLFEYLANDPSEENQTIARGLIAQMARRGIRLRELEIDGALLQLGLARRVEGRYGQQLAYEDESDVWDVSASPS